MCKHNIATGNHLIGVVFPLAACFIRRPSLRVMLMKKSNSNRNPTSLPIPLCRAVQCSG